jgi:chaperonin GroES
MADDYESEEAPAETGGKPTFEALFKAQNVVDLLDDETLTDIGATVLAEYEIDVGSLTDWMEKNEEGIALAMMLAEQKDYPFRSAANIKHPLVAMAALQFNARAYPAICPPDRVVRGKTFGKDPEGLKAARADRVSEHMSYQCLEEMPEWEGDTDKLTLKLPITGEMYRKVFYNPALKRKETRLLGPERLVYNYWARSFDDVRKTERLQLYPYEIRERINDKRFIDFNYTNVDKANDEAGDEDAGAPHEFLEQHRLWDLDGDGYPEPYVVTVHKGTQQVCRIKANWSQDTAVVEQDDKGKIKVISLRPETYFVKYEFLPSPDGGSHGLGFGWLLSSTNDAINTTLNQIFDAAHLANIQGGFISAALGPKQRNQTFRFEQGEWKYLNTTGALRDSIMPVTYPGPSSVLMSLLEFLIGFGKELASIKDVLTGDTPTTAPVGTTQMLIEQGLQVFSSIYKRIYRGLKAEFKLHARLNAAHVTPEEYAEFFDDPNVDPQADYDLKDMGVLPVSDPQTVTKAQKIAMAQTIYGLAQDNPTINKAEATTRVLEAIGVEDVEKLMVPPPQPDPELEALMKRGAEAEVATKEAEAEDKIAAATQKLAGAIKAIADAEGVEVGNQVGAYAAIVNMLKTEHGMEMDLAGQGGIPGMEGQPGNPMGAGALPAGNLGAGPAGGGEPVQLPSGPAGGMGGQPSPDSLQQGVL